MKVVADVATNHIGEQYNSLTIVAGAGTQRVAGALRHLALCRCACGKEVVKRLNHVIYGYIKSCGCLKAGRKKCRNEYIIKDNVATVTDNMGNEFLIDADDVFLLKDNYYHVNKDGYVVNTPGKLIHTLITKCPKGMVVDHINHNPTDNRKSNLRVCYKRENNKNRKRPGGVLQYNSGRWYALITVDYKVIRLGTFETEREARLARKQAEKKYYGEFASKEVV